MAIAFRAADAKRSDGTDPWSISPNIPTGTAADDIVILIAGTIAGNTISITADGSITPWTLIASPDVTGGEHIYVWWGRYSSGTTGPTVVPSGDHIVGTLASWSGCITSGSPINVSETGSEATSDTTGSFATTISTSENNTMVILASSTGPDSNTAQHSAQANANLGSIAERVDHNTNAGGGGGYQLTEGTLATAGTVGTWSWTLLTASEKSYVTFALKEAPPGAGLAQDLIIIGGLGG